MLQIGEVFSKLSGQVIRYAGVEVVIGGFWDFAGNRRGDEGCRTHSRSCDYRMHQPKQEGLARGYAGRAQATVMVHCAVRMTEPNWQFPTHLRGLSHSKRQCYSQGLLRRS